MLAGTVAILCSLGFLAIGFKLGRWHEQANRKRAERQRRAELDRQFDAIVRLAAEEEADNAGRCIDWYDARSGVVRRVRWDGPRLTSFYGGSA